MEKEGKKNKNSDTSASNHDPNLSEVLEEIKKIKKDIELFNLKMNSSS